MDSCSAERHLDVVQSRGGGVPAESALGAFPSVARCGSADGQLLPAGSQ